MKGVHFPTKGSSIVAFTAEERPDLWEGSLSPFRKLWPEYNHHGNDSGKYFGALFPRYGHVQILLFDRTTEQVVARGRTIPFRWDGSLRDLPHGIDAVGLRAVDDPQTPTSLSALSAEVVPDQQGKGLSRLVLLAMAEVARQAGLAPLVAPVRPSWKDRYSLIPMDRYVSWKRTTRCPLTRGYECTLDWEPRSSGLSQNRCESKRPFTIGSSGQVWHCLVTGITCFRQGSRPFVSKMASAPTGNPTCGCTTSYDPSRP